MEFYDLLVDDYDSMTNFEKRMHKEIPVFEKLLEEYGFTCALDAGCGSGFHSILLSNSGLKVIGIDTSKKMIARAKKNALKYKVSVEFLKADFSTFHEHVCGPFDAIFCLGNTLAHVLNNDELGSTIANFREVLTEQGCLIIQLLNYSKILSGKERIVGITESKEKIFIRFYDFRDRHVQFNILILEKKNGGYAHELFSTQLYPWRLPELQKSLQENGFKSVEYFSDLSKNEFDENVSKNLVVFAV